MEGGSVPGPEPSAVRVRCRLDVLHDDDDLSARGVRDRVPDSQAIGRKMEPIGTRQRILVGKRVSERRDWLFEQV